VLAAIRSLADGTPPASPRVVTSLFSYVASLQHDEQPALAPTLTPREEQILELLAEGFSNREIAGRLFLQPQTVKNYVHMVLQKMNMRSRLDVIRRLRSLKR
jgi:DNA-binding NarL/FixJ family response regulator